MAGEGAQQRQALKDGEAFGDVSMKNDGFDWPRDVSGRPLIKITCAAAELIPTVQYGNVTVGPVSGTRFVVDTDDTEELLSQFNWLQTVVERAVAEERKSIQMLMRARAERSAA